VCARGFSAETPPTAAGLGTFYTEAQFRREGHEAITEKLGAAVWIASGLSFQKRRLTHIVLLGPLIDKIVN
jgi:hypothetical protein